MSDKSLKDVTVYPLHGVHTPGRQILSGGSSVKTVAGVSIIPDGSAHGWTRVPRLGDEFLIVGTSSKGHVKMVGSVIATRSGRDPVEFTLKNA